MYVCMYVCMYVSISISIYLSIYICLLFWSLVCLVCHIFTIIIVFIALSHCILHHLSGDYMIPIYRHEISTRPAGADFIPQLHGEIKFHHVKERHFSTWYLFRFVPHAMTGCNLWRALTIRDLSKMGQSCIPINQDNVILLICSFSDYEFESYEFTKNIAFAHVLDKMLCIKYLKRKLIRKLICHICLVK